MKLRHAAALVLVGWYLMIPITSPGHLDNKAPISKWTISGSFDKEVDCSDRLDELFKKASKGHDKLLEDAFGLGACVSTDDPRLAK